MNILASLSQTMVVVAFTLPTLPKRHNRPYCGLPRPYGPVTPEDLHKEIDLIQQDAACAEEVDSGWRI